MQDLPRPTKSLLAIGAASKALGVSIDTIRRWDRLGKIRVVRTPGGTRLIPKNEIERLKAGVKITPEKLPEVKEPVTPQIPTPIIISNPIEPAPSVEPVISPPQPTIEPTPSVSTVPTPAALPVETSATPTVSDELRRIHQKIINNIRFYRPVWYQRWHTHPASRPTHLAILGVALIIASSLFFYYWFLAPSMEQSDKKIAELGKTLAAVSPPRILSFQGRLTDNNNVPINSPKDVKFRIYTSASGDTGDPCASTCKWESTTWTVSPDQNGIFSVILGDPDKPDNAISDTLFSENAALYLGVKVGSDAEMTPRQRISSVSYALNSDALEGFHGSQSPGLNQVPILDGSGNMMFAGAATIGTGTSGALTLDSDSGTLTLGAGTNTIVNTDATTALLINPTGDLQFQSSSNYVTSTGNMTLAGSVSIAASQSYTGAGAVTLSSATDNNLTLNAAGTGTLWFSGYDCSGLLNDGTLTALNTGEVVCQADDGGGGGGALHQVTAATSGGSAQDSNANSIFWNWDFISAGADSGLTISESSASTNGLQDEQALLEITTLTGSTASPLQITNDSTDVGDVWINLANAGDFEIQDAGTAFATFADDGSITLGKTDNVQVTPAGDILFVDADGSASITGPAGGALSVIAGASQALNLTGNAASTWSIGSANALTITSSNFSVATTGTITLGGSSDPIITTANAVIAQSFLIMPGSSSSSGGAPLLLEAGEVTDVGSAGYLSLYGGLASGSTGGTGGEVDIRGGNATGASGTRTGGGVFLNPGTGASANGVINIGSLNPGNINIGTATGAKTITIGETGSAGNTIAIGTGTGADTINIGTGATNADTITVGNINIPTTLTFNTGTATGTDPTLNNLAINLQANGTGNTNTLQGLVITQNDTATTGVYDTLLKLTNLKTPETTANGLFIEQNAASGTLTNGIQLTNTAGTFTNGINFTGTFSNFIAGTLGSSTTGTINGVSITSGSLSSGTQNVISATLTAATNGIINGLNITPPATTGGTTNGINIGAITTSTGTDTAIKFGSGWDVNLGSTASDIIIQPASNYDIVFGIGGGTTIDVQSTMGTPGSGVGLLNLTTSCGTCSHYTSVSGSNLNVGVIIDNNATNITAQGINMQLTPTGDAGDTVRGLYINVSGGASPTVEGITLNGNQFDTAIKISDVQSGTSKGIDLGGTSMTTGTSLNITTGNSVTSAGANTGSYINVSGVASGTGFIGTGIEFKSFIGAGGILQELSPTFNGASSTASGLKISTTDSSSGSACLNIFDIAAFTAANRTSGSTNAINIGNLSSADPDVTETAIKIGTGWDNQVGGNGWSVDGSGNITVAGCTGCGGGSQTPWTSDIQAAQFDLKDLSNLEFNSTTTGAPTGVAALFADSAGSLNLNVLTNKTFDISVNDSDEYNFSSTGLEFNSNNITGIGNITASGTLTIQSGSASNISLLAGTSAQTQNIQIGAGGSTTPDLLVLDVKSDTGNPSGTNGAMYYNSFDSKFRCYQNGGWSDCLTAGAASYALHNITAATSTNTISSGTNQQNWNWSVTTQTGLALSGGSAMTTGGAFSVGVASTNTYVHGANSEIGSLVSLAFSDTTSGAYTGTTNGLLVSPTINITAGAATKTINGLSVNPTFTACTTATCNVNGLNIAQVTDSGNFTSAAIQIGTGWDKVLDSSTVDISGAGVISGATGLTSSGTITFSGLTSCASLATNGSGVLACGNGPTTKETSGSGSVALTTTEQSLISLAITPASSSDEILIIAKFTARSSTTGDRTTTLRIRQGADCTAGQVGTDAASFSTNNSGDDYIDVFAVRIHAPATTNSTTYQLCARADNTSITATYWDLTLMEINQGADYAELYNTNDTAIEQGDVVSLDPALSAGVKKSTRAYESGLIGVVSTRPNTVIGGGDRAGTTAVPIALAGRVPVKVNGENGPIAVGDLITSSSTPGVGMKATKAGYVIGRAMTTFSGDEEGVVLAFVNTHYANPAVLDYDGSLLGLEPSDSATASARFSLDSENNLVATISAGTKFVWTNSVGKVVAWVSDTGEAVFEKVTALVGDFNKLVFGELAVKKESQTAGQASFEPDQTEVFIKSDKVAEDSLIYVTAKTKTAGLTLYIKEQKAGEGFTVGLERSVGDQPDQATASATQTIKFNWLIINRE